MRIPLRWRAALRVLRWLPQGGLSRAWGRIASVRLPRPLRGPVNRGFARLFGVDLTEARHPPEAYPSLSAFFVRRLRDGARSWPEGEGVGCPVDGVVGACGRLDAGTALQAKGIRYGVADLLDGGAADFTSGLFFTIYLSPRHYHRIHAPCEAVLREARAVPGRLLPVNRPAVHAVADLFPRNERLVARLEAPDARPHALIAIGAYNVGSIEAVFDPEWNEGAGVTNRPGGGGAETRRYRPPLTVGRGEELMAFHLGSTVVLLLGGDDLPPIHPDLAEGQEVRVGTPLLADAPGHRPSGVTGRSSAGPAADPGTR